LKKTTIKKRGKKRKGKKGPTFSKTLSSNLKRVKPKAKTSPLSSLAGRRKGENRKESKCFSTRGVAVYQKKKSIPKKEKEAPSYSIPSERKRSQIEHSNWHQPVTPRRIRKKITPTSVLLTKVARGQWQL